ncbi:MAG: sugar transferase [Ruminococcus sp.]|nr:sugar transferase [Ruminococcus sp.]
MNFYEASVKDRIDSVMAYCGIVALSPVLLGVSAAIYLDDPGPVFFKQKRIGKNKEYFELYKFRSMKMSTPHDMPTHMLSNPDQYITRVGSFLRKSSLDELPQLLNIFMSQMSVIGPRPALWNQDDLIAERDKYNANDVKPGLTGLAQISGRDELEIDVKAKIDGDYVKALKSGSLKALAMDIKCFTGTISSVLRHDGVVEGGTGEMAKKSAKK